MSRMESIVQRRNAEVVMSSKVDCRPRRIGEESAKAPVVYR